MVRALSSVTLLVIVPLFAEAIFFGNNNCCCGCAQPQPSSCGCQQPICPPPQPCPPPPVCPPPPPPVACPGPPPPPPCPPPPACPPPPVAVCPAPQPVYVQNPCASSGCSSYATGTYSAAPASSGCRTRYVVIRAPTATFNGEVKPALINTIQSSVAATETDEVQGASPGAADGYRKARGAPTLNEPKCNSKELKELIEENIVPNNPVESKRKIHKSAISAIDTAIVDVICSDSGFTYIVSTAEHCEAQKEGVICFAYKRP